MADNIFAADAAIHKPFKWYQDEATAARLPGDGVLPFVAQVQDIARGAQTILDILHAEDLGDMNHDRPLLDNCARGDLMRMAIAALGAIADNAEHMITWAEKHHMPQRRTETA